VLMTGTTLLVAMSVDAPPPVTFLPAEPATASSRARATGTAVSGESRCRRLRGRDLAPSRNVKLVRRRNADDGTDLLGCVLPRGRVRKLASSADLETTVEGYSVRQVAGAIVLLATTHDSQYVSATTISVTSIRTGRAYVIARSCARLAEGPCDGRNTTAAAALVNSRGQAAAAITTEGTDMTTIAGFSSKGRRRDLDSGPVTALPAASLRLRGSRASWTHSGQTRTATLRG